MNIRHVIIPIGPSIAYVPLTQGLYSLIDSDNAEWVERNNWYAHWYGTGYYAQRQGNRNQGKQTVITLHSEILKPQENLLADHANCNGLDNRLVNLRPATRAENAYNRRIQRDNRRGLKGIVPAGRRWVAQARVRGKQIYLGTFDTPEIAHEAYCKAIKELHGEFARTA